eukprot:PhF_6_TR21680/c0_g1_i1/m.30948/K00826/E2.6.1.42, ilvE; branched-chain amino acid aminotransferase
MLTRSFTKLAYATTFHVKDISTIPSSVPANIPNMDKLKFGTVFTPHTVQVDWNDVDGWGKPYFANTADGMKLDYSASVLHYGLGCFEGMKAFLDSNGNARLFRPKMNAMRLRKSSERLMMPGFDPDEFVELVKLAVRTDKNWIPTREGYSLYIRPTIVSTEPILGVARPHHAKLFVLLSPVGPYYPEGFKPIALLADHEHIRAWPGGTGSYKIASNYAPTIAVSAGAEKFKCSQVLWLGPHGECTEAGSMNIMFVLRYPNNPGQLHIVTSPANELVLPGITRWSCLELMRGWGNVVVEERDILIDELIGHIEDGTLVEMFGCGTAAVVTLVNGVNYKGANYVVPCDPKSADSIGVRLLKEITDIQMGRTPSDWSVVV